MNTSTASAAPSIGLVSLGCPKALVDSERIVTHLASEGYRLSPSYDGADVVIVNTCGFLDSARCESLDAIGEALAENGKVIVTGCLGADPEAVRAAHPRVLAVTGPHQYAAVVDAVHRVVAPPRDPSCSFLPPQGLRLTPPHYAYLKISEGCDNRCSFCLIPALRGGLVSRPLDEVMAEAETLAQAGVRELVVVSQDTTAYGRDLGHEQRPWKGQTLASRLPDLARALGDLGVWVRLMYAYPGADLDAVIPLMAEGKILPYLDMPLQHASPAVLKRMRRPAALDRTLERIGRWREQCPDLVLRSTFITGFPGETEEDVRLLMEFLEEARLDRVGVFAFEAVRGVEAATWPDAVDASEREARRDRVMALQKEISARKLRARVGSEMPVLIDTVRPGGVAVGRSVGDAPEVDGTVVVETAFHLRPGDLVPVRITGSDAYDLRGVPNRDARTTLAGRSTPPPGRGARKRVPRP
ncbi:30S ribosomal protein S12 methylthiotransferase RimO [Phaeovibrio sulfidiphilus]|uniref:Ribosomal protein uS12 methylthiotransferase RimO n=1 Tax=Phaeovibrio sulfidiphilus TaxID=1220600 RepID=A0A8J6YQC9_9PROT|nr:30S ribosomal protein S12 methylthiotransferase RimO [Phaeovibrio sulfidiphilus]MBE1237884.1 30S ribosomal protein S12 methylthiotransferase RimO [Phaeovibrio sulfidiphilus]